VTVWLVTGTDTGVGKTVVTAALTAILRGRGMSVAVVKPSPPRRQPHRGN
jgi:dethiobiotin synthetase